MTTSFYPIPHGLGELVTGCGAVGRCPILSERHPLAFSTAKTVVFDLYLRELNMNTIKLKLKGASKR